MQLNDAWSVRSAISTLRRRQVQERSIKHWVCPGGSHQQGRTGLREAIAKMYTPLLGREIDANKEVVVTVGANEGSFYW